MDMAELIASWSKDPNTKVGCVVARSNWVVAQGYNGFPVGIQDTEERLSDKDLKNSLMLHAEENAILSAPESLQGTTAYVTKGPCDRCALRLIQAGIKRVVFPQPATDSSWYASILTAKKHFAEAGVVIDSYI